VPPAAPHGDDDVPFDVERLVFFSDAVFAIAITLLVIELGVPERLASDEQLREALADLAPSFFSFFLSFAVTALWWLSHHRVLRLVERTSGALVALNFLLLAAVAFLPFSSGVLGHHGDLSTAVILYAATNTVAVAALVGIRLLVVRRGLLRADVDLVAFRRRTAFAAGNLAVFVASVPVALASPTLATWSWALVFVLAVVRIRLERRRGPRPRPDGEG
jgi:uncharacterized membrane protein